jgi:hypothetical protein
MTTKDEIVTQIENDWGAMAEDVMNAENALRVGIILNNAKAELMLKIQDLIDLAYEDGQNNVLEAMNG